MTNKVTPEAFQRILLGFSNVLKFREILQVPQSDCVASDWTGLWPIIALSTTDAITASSIMAVVFKGFPFNLPFASILLILLLCLQSGGGQKKKEVLMH